MAVTKKPARQQIILAFVDISFADLVSGVAADIMELPVNAVVTGGDVVTSVAWNSVTSDVIVVGDAASAARYFASTTIHAINRNPLVPTGFQYTAKTNLQATVTSVGGSLTAGQTRICVHYYIANRSQWTQGQVAKADGTFG